MIMAKLIPTLFLFILGLSVNAQTFVGEIETPEGHQYLKLVIDRDSLFVSLPYEFRQTFGFGIEAKEGAEFLVEARAESRRFTFQKVAPDRVELTTAFTGRPQAVVLKKQLAPIEEGNLAGFTGNYVDDTGNRAVVYTRRGYLHLMTPYEEQTVSLKPVGANQFWSTTGESTVFTDYSDKEFQQLAITNRHGQEVKLRRSFSYRVIEDWVVVDGDSIYVNLFVPNLNGRKPACLLLPGGGARPQMDNAVYEARFFAAHGLVAMTFDKASVGKSKGRSFENYTFKEKAKRYQQLFDYLLSHEEVDPEKVGLHGPSEGGRLALMMGAGLGGRVAFINATAAPLMTSLEGQLYAANHYSRNLGMTEEEIISTLLIWKNYYQGILNEKIDTAHFFEIRELRAKYNRAFLPPTSDIIPLSPKKEDLVDNSVLTEAHKLECPVFLQYGEHDQRVDPTGSLQNFYQSISESGNVAAELYKRGNHSMMTPEFEICSGYAYDKAKWLKSIRIIR